ncbi:hypothetical protein [Alicyclobacillus dauci]|uniref:Uncharacterized protein n=1 Tax=Alicyclobacillus dauci TaxID=1475485 RepID=A0ABY6YX28_9BACL|nr:hypothetical protein [Alicyclobacillus dauci]WAH35057.1 hypothetical protein NZD86_12035 [Alicyclobacillus dauci]
MANGQLIIPGTASPSDVLATKTFSAGSNYGAAGTMANNGSLTVNPAGSAQTFGAGYYSGITVNPGSQKASGTTTSSSGQLTFLSHNYSSAGLYYITVSGLSFQPSLIVIEFHNGSAFGRTIYSQFDGDGTGDFIKTSTNTSTWMGYVDGSSAYVNSSGFQLPTYVSASPGTWYAYS